MPLTITRRAFLRQATLTAAGALAATCGARTPDPTPTSGPAATATPGGGAPPTRVPTETPQPGLRLDAGLRSDVWAWEARLDGTTAGGLNCASVTVQANDRLVEAELTDTGFTAVIPIVTGENTVTASCAGAAGEVQSRVVHYDGKLARRPRAQMTLSLQGNRLILAADESRDAQGGNGEQGHDK